ncbi:MAG: diguanylate cyclase (GGDEF)-like protein [Planctomycetota bacterium]|jgi:diguanylate cyclase (GGDEF)-like protein
MVPNQPHRILVCDHRGEGTQNLLRPLAAMGFELTFSSGLGETLRLLGRGAPNLLVLDPLSRGGTAELERLRAALPRTGVPVMLIADPTDPLPSVLAARALGDLPFDLAYRGAPMEELLLRVEQLMAQVGRVEELEVVRYAATHDDLTGLLRIGPFGERLSEHFSAAQRHHLNLALVIVDLDRFGAINKDFDHTVGDKVISQVGQVIADFLRTEDVAGRIGGDEFAMVLPYTQKVDAARVVGRIRDQVESLSGPLPGGGSLRVAASIGFETYDGSDLESVSMLRRHAEIALRHAKLQGGNRAVYYRSLESHGGAAAQTAAESLDTEGPALQPPEHWQPSVILPTTPLRSHEDRT